MPFARNPRLRRIATRLSLRRPSLPRIPNTAQPPSRQAKEAKPVKPINRRKIERPLRVQFLDGAPESVPGKCRRLSPRCSSAPPIRRNELPQPQGEGGETCQPSERGKIERAGCNRSSPDAKAYASVRRGEGEGECARAAGFSTGSRPCREARASSPIP